MDPNAKPAPVEDQEIEAGTEEVEVPQESAVADEPVTVDPAEEAATEAEMKALTNATFAKMRKEAADAKKALAERDAKIKEYEERYKQQPEPVTPAQNMYGPPKRMIAGTPVPETREEWDALARKDWQLAVDMRSILNAQKLQEESKTAERSLSTLEESKQEVLERHPELSDATTEKGRIFVDILRKNPQYAQHPEGPILVMHKMEKELRRMGYTEEQIFGGTNNKPQVDATKASRAALTGAGRTTEKPGRTVTLSKDDLEFCKAHGLDPKVYAKEKLDNEARMKGAQL